MWRTRSELLEKIRLGEDTTFELKEVRFAGGKVRGPTQDALADEIAAFANRFGGELVLGVSDDREIMGIPVERLDDVERLVRQACEQSIRPSIAPFVERMTLPDADGSERPILRVGVERSLFVHLSPGGYVRRGAASKEPIGPDHLARLFQQRSQSRLIRFDETPVNQAPMTALVGRLWRRFAPQPTTDTDEVLLGKLAMAGRGEDGAWHPTVAGLLLGSDRPDKALPGAFVQAVAYQGNTVVPGGEVAYQRDAQDLVGPLDRQILETCSFVRKNMRVAAFKHTEGGRDDVPQFSMRAVFEAITNAVAHRDYSMAGSKVRVRLFDDRLEIYSPGMLPNTMTTESLELRQSARNEAITSLLARCPIEDQSVTAHRQHIMDKRGEGVPVILAETQRLAGKPATYRLIDESELLLTIPAAQPESDR